MGDMQLPHGLTLDQRRDLTVTGVAEVVSFDENSVVLNTAAGTLVVQGSELQLKTLSEEGGRVAVTGQVSALHYEQSRSSEGWLSRLLR